MSWVKLDDAFPDHPKVAPLNDKAFRVHVRALCYAGRYLTDGFIPHAVASDISRGRKQAVDELVNAGLWLPNGGSGYLINDYLEYNPSRDETETERQRKKDLAKKAADARWDNS